jgi:hypothetical protein
MYIELLCQGCTGHSIAEQCELLCRGVLVIQLLNLHDEGLASQAVTQIPKARQVVMYTNMSQSL